MLPYPDLELQKVSEQVMFHSVEVLLPSFDCYTIKSVYTSNRSVFASEIIWVTGCNYQATNKDYQW